MTREWPLTFSPLFQTYLRRSLRQTVSCCAIEEHIQYAQDDESNGPSSTWACELEDGRILTISNIDRLPPAIRQRLESGVDCFTFREALVTRTQLSMSRNANNLSHEKRRNRRNNLLGILGGQSDANQDNIFDSREKGHRRRLEEGTRTVLVVRVIASDNTTTASQAALSDSVFGTNGDAVNLKSQYSACSYGKLNFVAAPNRNGSPYNIANGATTVTTLSTSTGEGDVEMRNDITAALKSQFSVNAATDLADYVMYCLPPGTMSGIAYAFVNSWMSVYDDRYCTYLSTQVKSSDLLVSISLFIFVSLHPFYTS